MDKNSNEGKLANEYADAIDRVLPPNELCMFLDLLRDVRRIGIDSIDKRETLKRAYDLIGDHEHLMRTFFEFVPVQDAMDASIMHKKGNHDSAKVDPNRNDVKGEPSENEPGQGTSVQGASVQGTSVQGTSVQETPVDEWRYAIDYVDDIKRVVTRDQLTMFLDLLIDVRRIGIDSIDKRDILKRASDLIGNHEHLMQTFFEFVPIQDAMDASGIQMKGMHDSAKVDPNRNDVKGEPSENEPGQETSVQETLVQADRDIDNPRSVVQVVEKEFPNTNSKASSELKVVEEDILKEFA